MTKQYTIGIDPGTSTGIAVFDRNSRQIVRAETLDFWAAYDLCLAEYPPAICDLIIEDCSKNKVQVYARLNAYRGSRVAANVGGVKRESQLLIDGLRRRGYNVVAIRPQGSKWDTETVKRITGWNRRVSEHARDAIRLCFGVTNVRAQEAMEAA
jgi:hypothetical protein